MYTIQVRARKAWRPLRVSPKGKPLVTNDLLEALNLAEFLMRHGIPAFVPEAPTQVV